MTRLLIYVFPALMDTIVALSMFTCSVRAARELQLDAFYVASMVPAWGVAYMVTCPIVGRFMNRRNAARLLIFSCLAAALLCGAFTVIESGLGMFIGMVVMGVVAAFFFGPFQIFMAAVDEGGAKPLPFSTGMYTFSWSLGFAAGPFVIAAFSWLDKLMADGYLAPLRMLGERLYGPEDSYGRQFSYLFAIALLLVNAIGIAVLARHAHPHENASAAPAQVGGHDYSRQPNYAFFALIGAGIGIFSISMFRAVFPKYADPDVLDLSTQAQSMVFFVLSLVQALVGLALCWSKTWMYRTLPLVGAGLFGVAGLLCLGLGTNMTVFLIGATAYGVYSGCFFFYFVFHAIAHPEKASRQVGTNEALVGVMGIVAPFLGGWSVDKFNMQFPFVACAILVVLALFFQGWVHRGGFRPAEEAA